MNGQLSFFPELPDGPLEPEVFEDLPDSFFADEKLEAAERYWFWDDSDYARQVCVKRWGEI